MNKQELLTLIEEVRKFLTHEEKEKISVLSRLIHFYNKHSLEYKAQETRNRLIFFLVEIKNSRIKSM